MDANCHESATDGFGPPAAASRLLHIALAFWSSRLLLCADELGIFTALACGPMACATLSSRLGLKPDATADFLHGLLELGLIDYVDGLFQNTPDGDQFLAGTAPRYLGHWLAMARATQAEPIDLAAYLRAPAPSPSSSAAPPSLSDRMWADVGDVIRAAISTDGL
jgi:hypothetical protein